VHAAAITFAELTWDLEWTTRDGKDRTPVIPSHKMSGIVAGLGADAAGLAAGDEVIGLIDFDRDGAAAEYVAMPAAGLAAKPPSLSHVAAATLPLAALTAWQALADHPALQPGEQVLVQGGAGGVGIFAVQFAAILGGHVTATGRSADAGLVRDLGAERCLTRGHGKAGRGEAPAPEHARARQRRAWRKEFAKLSKIRFLLAMRPGAGPPCAAAPATWPRQEG
jgi:NADPH:quinone reductase-like Zn-dependent oxidoreductase